MTVNKIAFNKINQISYNMNKHTETITLIPIEAGVVEDASTTLEYMDVIMEEDITTEEEMRLEQPIFVVIK